MRRTKLSGNRFALFCTAFCCTLLPACSTANTQVPAASTNHDALAREVHTDMDFLASDNMRGRGSATQDEYRAAVFCAQQMKALGLTPGGDNGTYIQKAPMPPLSERAAKRLSRFEDVPRTATWNAIAVLQGADPKLRGETILLTAHLDHLGVLKPTADTTDLIYNGADDDASGTTAVLALMRFFATGPKPARTIVFALFGSEELGDIGSKYFLNHMPVPVASIVANVEFEMIGRPDPLIAANGAWMAGFDRSTLGPELAKHGAPLVADPHPEKNFFSRSDNYALAKEGIIAHSISSFGLHSDYHQPSDEISRIDFGHLVAVIEGMEPALRWLVDTNWRPEWNDGGKP